MSALDEGGVWCGTCYRSAIHAAAAGGCTCPRKAPRATVRPVTDDDITATVHPYLAVLHGGMRTDETVNCWWQRRILAVLRADAARLPGEPPVYDVDVTACLAAYKRAALDYEMEDDDEGGGPTMSAGLRGALETWRARVAERPVWPIPEVDEDGTTGPDGDECSQDCVCRR